MSKSYNKGCWGRWCGRLMIKKKDLEKQIRELKSEMEGRLDGADEVIYQLKMKNKFLNDAVDFLRGKLSKWPNMLGYIEEADEIIEGKRDEKDNPIN